MSATNISVKLIEILKAHKGAVFALDVPPNSDNFYSGCGNGYLLKWNINYLDKVEALARIPSNIFCIKHIIDNLLLAGTLQGNIYFINPNEKQLVKQPIQLPKAIYAFLPIGNICFVACGDGRLYTLDLEKLEITYSSVISSKALRAINHYNNNLLIATSDGSIYEFDVQSKTVIRAFTKHTNSVFCQMIAGDILITGSRDAHLCKWDLVNANLLDYIPAHNFTINQIVKLGSLPIFATASRDRSIKIWDENLNLLKVIDFARYGAHLHSVNNLRYLNKSGYLLSASDDKTLALWKIEATNT